MRTNKRTKNERPKTAFVDRTRLRATHSPGAVVTSRGDEQACLPPIEVTVLPTAHRVVTFENNQGERHKIEIISGTAYYEGREIKTCMPCHMGYCEECHRLLKWFGDGSRRPCECTHEP